MNKFKFLIIILLFSANLFCNHVDELDLQNMTGETVEVLLQREGAYFSEVQKLEPEHYIDINTIKDYQSIAIRIQGDIRINLNVKYTIDVYKHLAKTIISCCRKKRILTIQIKKYEDGAYLSTINI